MSAVRAGEFPTPSWARYWFGRGVAYGLEIGQSPWRARWQGVIAVRTAAGWASGFYGWRSRRHRARSC